MGCVDLITLKALWGNYAFTYAISPPLGSSGEILCVWESSMLVKENVSVLDSFLLITGTWVPTATRLLIISVYAPKELAEQRLLWEYLCHVNGKWDGECIILGDFNNFISLAVLVDLSLRGYSFTWAHKTDTKMSKLNRFLISKGLLTTYPNLLAICLDRRLSDHLPILLKEVYSDYGSIPFRIFHLWFQMDGFDKMVEQTWMSMDIIDTNGFIHIKKKLQLLKQKIRRIELMKSLNDMQSLEAMDITKKSKVRWSIEGDENTKFFHGILNKKRSHLSVRGVLMDGDSVTELVQVKHAFYLHFAHRFNKSKPFWLLLEAQFPNVLSIDQVAELERDISNEEIKRASVFLASGLKINIHKSKLMGIGVGSGEVNRAAKVVGCSTFSTPFSYLGVMVGGRMSRIQTWDEVVHWLSSRLSRWKLKTLLVRGRLTLLKLVLSVPMGGIEADQYDELCSGDFTIKSVCNFLDDSLLSLNSLPTRWVKEIPIKINIFAWKVQMDKLPSRLNFSRLSIDIPSLMCPIGESGVESLAHLLFSYLLARAVLAMVRRWWCFSSPELHSYEDWFSWFVDLRLYRKTKNVLEEHGRMILESVEHGLLIGPTIEENGATDIILQRLPPDVYALVNHHRVAKDLWERVQLLKQGDDPIDAINKIMSFMSTIVTSHFQSTNNYVRNSFNPRQHATIHDGRVTVQPLHERSNSYAAGTSRTRANTSGTRGRILGQQRIVKYFNCQREGNGKVLNEKELEFLADSGIAEGPVTQTVITNNAAYQANDLDAYDFNCDDITTAKVAPMANLSCYGSDVLSENEITSDSNIITYSLYLLETQNAVVQDINSSAQQDAMILYVFEQLSNQVTNCKKVNKDNLIANESLSTELKRYKEQEINSIKQILSEQLKEKEAKNIDKEIALEKKVKELDNIVYKMGQSTQTVHMLMKPQVFYDKNLKQALGFQNSFYLKKAQQIRPMLYDDTVIAKETNVISIVDSEETLILEEESRFKMHLKQSDPIVLEKKVNIKPVYYAILNQLSEDFSKQFVPQIELSAEQAFWLKSSPSFEEPSTSSTPIKTNVPK
ncbi:integrase, catalytic region, zinc finger, CCHC-type containing protein [Tanacetum coccineum]